MEEAKAAVTDVVGGVTGPSPVKLGKGAVEGAEVCSWVCVCV